MSDFETFINSVNEFDETNQEQAAARENENQRLLEEKQALEAIRKSVGKEIELALRQKAADFAKAAEALDIKPPSKLLVPGTKIRNPQRTKAGFLDSLLSDLPKYTNSEIPVWLIIAEQYVQKGSFSPFRGDGPVADNTFHVRGLAVSQGGAILRFARAQPSEPLHSQRKTPDEDWMPFSVGTVLVKGRQQGNLHFVRGATNSDIVRPDKIDLDPELPIQEQPLIATWQRSMEAALKASLILKDL